MKKLFLFLIFILSINLIFSNSTLNILKDLDLKYTDDFYVDQLHFKSKNVIPEYIKEKLLKDFNDADYSNLRIFENGKEVLR